MARASIPGAIVGVWQDGREPYVRAFGVRDTATGQPMTTDLYIGSGSTTKTFTVTAILMLVDQGKIGLDDPVDRYVKGVPGGDQITLRQLAAMRSGLYDYSEDTKSEMTENPGRQWTPRELLELAFRHPPVFPPGSKFDYNNTNTVLLGQVVENVSGESIGSLHRKEHPETGRADAHTVPSWRRVSVAARPRLLQDAGRQGRRCDGLESIVGRCRGADDLNAR
jgi:D-alanyl-D-alanine carboxypeptidase